MPHTYAHATLSTARTRFTPSSPVALHPPQLRAIRTAREQLLPLNQRTEESKASAQRRDKKTHTELNGMRHLPINAACADCGAKHPGWAALPHGVFLCIDCAQIHRGIGRHISQVKCISSHTCTLSANPPVLAHMATTTTRPTDVSKRCMFPEARPHHSP